MSETLLEFVRSKLRGGSIKLWLPPYIDAGGQRDDAAIIALLPRVFPDRSLPVLANVADGVLVDCLYRLQEHALQKMKSKSAVAQVSPSVIAVHAKVIGTTVPRHAQTAEGKPNMVILPSIPTSARWADLRKEILHKLFGDTVGSANQHRANLRLIARGRLVAEGDSIVDSRVSSSSPDGVLSVLAIVKEHNVITPDKPAEDAILQKAQKIREAAALLAGKDFHGDFELTDQHGRAVRLPPQDRGNLCAALSLHALGKKVLHSQASLANPTSLPAAGERAAETRPIDSAAPPTSTEGTGKIQQRFAEALSFLLEADAAWSNVGGTWQQQVDNYGFLQLDITWCLLNLEHLSALPDASARISRTEEVLGKQVNPNFLKLAIFNAEQGRAVPPLAAPFVRLLLLKGVIRLLHERDARAAIETLTEAGALCKALEVDPEHTEQLLQLGTSEEGAIAALRKAGGDVQRAAVDILDQVEKGRVAAEDRKKQRMFGPTADKASYVNLERIAVVRDVLSVDYDVAVSLLRLSNNSIDVAADLWHQAGRDRSDILERAYNIAPRSTKKLRPQQTAQPPVDEIALVTLMSTGIDKELAEAALRGTANEGADPVEAAMAWLNGDGVLAAGFADTNPAPEVEGERIDSQMRDDHDPVGKLPDQMSESSRGDSDSVDEEFASAEEQEALELLQHELAGVLRKSNLAEEHLGVTLQEERVLIDRYLSLAHSQVSA